MRYHSYRAVFDFECLLETCEEKNDPSKKLVWEANISLSAQVSVVMFRALKTPMHHLHLETEPNVLVQSILEHLSKISRCRLILLNGTFQHKFCDIEANILEDEIYWNYPQNKYQGKSRPISNII